MEDNKRWQKIIKRSVCFFIIVLILAVVGVIILKYNVEGEQSMPFDLSEILIVSSAEGYEQKESKYNWDVQVYQTNDICLNIKKNKNYKSTEIIKSIEVSNIEIQNPKIGEIEIYIPNSDNQKYRYEEQYKLNNNIKYIGDKKTDLENLKISNQGGNIIFRIINKTGKRFTSNDDELKHDGTLLDKVQIQNEDIKFKINFEVIIELESDVSYVGKIELELPIGDIIKQGVSNFDKTNTKDIVFKRK